MADGIHEYAFSLRMLKRAVAAVQPRLCLQAHPLPYEDGSEFHWLLGSLRLATVRASNPTDH